MTFMMLGRTRLNCLASIPLQILRLQAASRHRLIALAPESSSLDRCLIDSPKLGLLGCAFELACVEQHLPLLPDHLPFLLQKSLHGSPEPSVDDVVDATRGLRIETSKLLETSAGARFKTFQAQMYAMLDGGIVANVEMQEGLLLESTPVPAIHRCPVPDIESAGDDFPVSLGQHQAHIRRQPAVNLIEKFRREVLAAVIVTIDMTFIKAKHSAHLGSRQIVPFERPDSDSSLTDFAPFSFNLVAPITAETAEIVIKCLKIPILPVKLETCPWHKPDFLQSLPLLAQAKVYMN
jgi:hypothetical protein